MKKIIAIMLVLAAMLSLAACGAEKEEAAAPEISIASGEEILNNIWDTMAEEQKFAAMGGDMNNMVDGAAGAFDLSDADFVLSFLHISTETSAMADSAATLVHAMNANTFTSAAFHVAEGSDKEAFAAAMKDEIMATQWLCGFPEVLTVYVLGDYVVYFLGNAEIVNSFKDGMNTVYGDAAVMTADASF